MTTNIGMADEDYSTPVQRQERHPRNGTQNATLLMAIVAKPRSAPVG
jgi:hypothetical protein